MRILVGQVFQEAHGFTPLRTGLDSFVIETGEAVIQNNADADSVLGGIIRIGFQQDWNLVPTIAARASPGGKVTDAAYAFIKERILEVARSGHFDAIALCLHGCIQTESLDSAEADLLKSLREIVGVSVPIVAGFDLHGHAGGGMLEHLDYATAYKTNPHGDAGATGERVGRVLTRILRQSLRPVAAKVTVPMLTQGNDETASGPLLRLHALASERIAASARLLDASIFNVNPFIDGEGVGQTALVYAIDEEGFHEAARLAEALGNGLWDARDEFQHRLPALDEALAKTRGRLIVGDFGDRVLAGGPGDSLFVVDELLRKRPALRVVAPLTDPAAVDACEMAGVGQTFTLAVGGFCSAGAATRTMTGTVRRTGHGTYRNRGAFMRGASLRIGRHAVFESGNCTLLLTCEPLMSQDPGCFLDCGIDLEAADVIVAKSGYHFKLAFDQLGECVCVATPGLTTYEPRSLPIQKARPLYPLDAFEYRATATRVGAAAG
ncbi:M81 family metallopeptidase [Variovorax sp. M-6]